MCQIVIYFLLNPDYAIESVTDVLMLDVQGCVAGAQAHPAGAVSMQTYRPCRR